MNNNQQNKEPNGARLLRFIDAHIIEIVRKEKSSARSINLYGTDGYWTAFDQSAYQICKLFSPETIAVISNSAYPFPVVMANISDSDLVARLGSCKFKCERGDYKELEAEEISAEDYFRWRREKIEALTGEFNEGNEDISFTDISSVETDNNYYTSLH